MFYFRTRIKIPASQRKNGINTAVMDKGAAFGMIVKKFVLVGNARQSRKICARIIKRACGALSPPYIARGKEEDIGAALRASAPRKNAAHDSAETALSGRAGKHTAAL